MLFPKTGAGRRARLALRRQQRDTARKWSVEQPSVELSLLGAFTIFRAYITARLEGGGGEKADGSLSWWGCPQWQSRSLGSSCASEDRSIALAPRIAGSGGGGGGVCLRFDSYIKCLIYPNKRYTVQQCNSFLCGHVFSHARWNPTEIILIGPAQGRADSLSSSSRGNIF